MIDRIEVQANGLKFAALADGPVDGRLALLLHGFPDCAWTWRYLLVDLAAAGFRAVAPWSHGYAPSDVPATGSYGVGALVADACALHDALGGDERAVLIGHDWGAVTAYPAAAFAPTRWSRLIALASPPVADTRKAFRDYEQLKRLFYVFLFQTRLAERTVAADDLAFVERLWQDWSPGYDFGGDLPAVKEALRDPANLSAAIGYYRAPFSPPDLAYAAEAAAAHAVAPQPTLYLHGDRDGCVAVDLITDAEASLSDGSKLEIISGVGHFLHVESPEKVNPLIVDWVT